MYHIYDFYFEDGCNFTTTPFDVGPNVIIEIEWPETNLGDTVSVPCPCAEFAGSLAGRAYRYCSGTFSQGAHWEDFDVSLCEALSSAITKRLCAAALLVAQVLFHLVRCEHQEQIHKIIGPWESKRSGSGRDFFSRGFNTCSSFC